MLATRHKSITKENSFLCDSLYVTTVVVTVVTEFLDRSKVSIAIQSSGKLRLPWRPR